MGGPVGAPRVCVPALRVTSRARIKHGPILAGVVTGIAGVVTVGRTYAASLFGRMTAYINGFIAIIPCYPGGKLLYITVQ